MFGPMSKRFPELSDADRDRIIAMAWEDRTPFDAIELQFGLPEKSGHHPDAPSYEAQQFSPMAKAGERSPHQTSSATPFFSPVGFARPIKRDLDLCRHSGQGYGENSSTVFGKWQRPKQSSIYWSAVIRILGHLCDRAFPPPKVGYRRHCVQSFVGVGCG